MLTPDQSAKFFSRHPLLDPTGVGPGERLVLICQSLISQPDYKAENLDWYPCNRFVCTTCFAEPEPGRPFGCPPALAESRLREMTKRRRGEYAQLIEINAARSHFFDL